MVSKAPEHQAGPGMVIRIWQPAVSSHLQPTLSLVMGRQQNTLVGAHTDQGLLLVLALFVLLPLLAGAP